MSDITGLTTHDDNISVTITLDAAANQERGFGTLLFIGDMAAAYFSQIPAPDEIKIAHVDTAGAETYAQAFAAVLAKTTDFYAVAIESRADAAITSIAEAVEANGNFLFFFQTDDASTLDAGLPAGISTVGGNEYSVGLYHTTDAQWGAEAFAGNRIVFDPDIQSAPWDAPVQGVTGHTSQLTQSQKDALDTNYINYGLPYGGESYFVDAGVNMAGRPIYEIVTAHWFKARLMERVSALKVNLSARGQKITVDKTGQQLVKAVIEELFEQGIAAQHFIAGQYTVTAEAISDADRDAQRLRFSGSAQIAVSARKFTFSFHFGRDPVTAEV
jgi:hypothetical protein